MKTLKNVLSVLLVVVMLTTSIPMVFAAEESTATLKLSHNLPLKTV